MADQSIRFPEGIAKDVMVRIHDHFAPTDFMVLDMGEEEDDTPIVLQDRSSTPPMRSSTLDLNKSTSNSLEKRYTVILIVTLLMSSQRSLALGGDVDHPKTRRINLQRMNGRKIRNLKELLKMNPLRQSQVHRPSRCGRRR